MKALATHLGLLCALTLCAPAALRAQEEGDFQVEADTDAEPTADELDAEAASDDAPLAVHGRVAAGLGVGMRSLGWPVDRSEATVDLGAFPAFDLGAAFSLGLARSFRLGLSFAYQSSIAHELREPRLNASAETQRVRSHRFEAALAPELRFGEETRLQVLAGYAVRNLHPETHHLNTPRVTLSGPVLRPMLRLGLVENTLALRFGPELMWIASVNEELQELGVKAGGIAVGGELIAELSLTDALSAELAYRESHALLDAKLGDASDVERFVTARLVGEL